MIINPLNTEHTWGSKEIDQLMNELMHSLDTYGSIQEGTRQNGEEILCENIGVPTLNNVQFSLNLTTANLMYLEEEIAKKDGMKGLRFLRQEAKEWVAKNFLNPGKAWEEYPERWKNSLNIVGKMDYTYHERLNAGNRLNKMIELLIDYPATRQAYIDLRNQDDSRYPESGRRIPCINGYQLNRDGKYINMTVMARSIDVNNCLLNDIWLAHALLKHIVNSINHMVHYAEKDKVDLGKITFFVSNLHAYPNIKEMI
ncbi:MAG: hypothetical protein KAS66_08270 [Candidatus Omnitrophica bacterium]|nr:hypothetical protein [Candidatus Omnitrophota bacterium]